MKRILILVAINFLMCSTASAGQGGGGESTKKGTSKKKVVTKRKTSGIKSANTTPPTPPGGARPAPKIQESRVDALAQLRNSLVIIPAGEFMMGSTNRWPPEQPVHRVSISQPFYMGKYEVTQEQWQAVMGNNPSYFKNCDKCPVEQVSWEDAQKFLAKLNERNDGFHYRLPSEAEWEYACRAGTTGDYAGGLDSMVWYTGNSGNKTHPVGSKQPNSWGLYDMHGNVSEWCQDWYHENYNGAPSDEGTWDTGGEQKYRVLRGGSWGDGSGVVRSAHRDISTRGDRIDSVGFRVVAVVRTQSTASVTTVVVEFPTSGSGRATKEVGLKAYLDPLKSHTRPSGPARYVFADDPLLFFDDVAGKEIDRSTNEKWWSMPAGKYVIHPRGVDEIFLTWW